MRCKRLSAGLRAALAIFAVTLFVTSTWAATREKVLHTFNPQVTDGVGPYSGLIVDAAGNRYGTTSAGGTYNSGTVFELTLQSGGGWTERVLYNFCSQTNCADGAEPYAGLTSDAAGNLYGTTSGGGTYSYYGTVFELTPGAGGVWTETVLHSFNYYGDGIFPTAGLIFDAAGNLYGTTGGGGGYGGYGQGTVFELTPQGGGVWTEQVLHNFGNGTDGQNPSGGLIFDAAGNLYGTTQDGGTHGFGTAFELTPVTGGGWIEAVLHNFNNNGTDGAYPYYVGLIFDAAGNLYGTTQDGGTYGFGTAFELTPVTGGGWMEKVLHSFDFNGTDGAYPYSGLILDATGDIYGTTYGGGSVNCGSYGYGCGTVFELTPTAGGGWTETVLHNFIFSGADGYHPAAGLIFDAAGNLYSTSYAGGTSGLGTVFELTPAAGGGWTENVLHNFSNTGTDDGAYPNASLIFDAAGNLYGTTEMGGTYSIGTVFELTPAAGGGWTQKVLHNFSNAGTHDGVYPNASLIFDAAGNLYGTTTVGGAYDEGTVFELTPVTGGGWMETLLYSFCPQNCTDGAYPRAGLIFDGAGNLYGTTTLGGAYSFPSGTVFELSPQADGIWTEQVLHSFGNGTDGQNSTADLIFDAAGNLYGTTTMGGTYYGGTVFELTPAAGGGWMETLLYNFCSQTNCTDGAGPTADLIFNAAGNLYSTTNQGGTYGYGTVFELRRTAGGGWTERLLHSFNTNGTDGAYPNAGVTFDAADNLYGTTGRGGIYGVGTLFRVSAHGGRAHVLHSFGNGTDGAYPNAGVIFDAAGNLYGTTNVGGTYNYGTVFEITPSVLQPGHVSDRFEEPRTNEVHRR